MDKTSIKPITPGAIRGFSGYQNFINYQMEIKNMKLFVREDSGEYRPATKKDVHAGAMAIARLQHLKPTISSCSAFMEYCQLNMSLDPLEHLRIFFLDNKNRLIGEFVSNVGVEDQTAVYPRQIAREAIERNATGIIIAHNHPTGQLSPSGADRTVTRLVQAAMEALDIRFLDHIIIGSEGKGYFSFRENGSI
jgi:DNA repair protein RadC